MINGTYYFNRRVPERLKSTSVFSGIEVVRWSLRTGNYLEAYRRYRSSQIRFERMCSQAVKELDASDLLPWEEIPYTPDMDKY